MTASGRFPGRDRRAARRELTVTSRNFGDASRVSSELDGADRAQRGRPGSNGRVRQNKQARLVMRNVILWLLGVPISVLVLLNVFNVI